jgi:TonB family protein
MKTLFACALLLLLPCLVVGQNIRYYKDRGLRKETTQEKARYEVKKERRSDGKVIIVVKDLSKEEILSVETEDGEPYGQRVNQMGWGKKVIDYDFDMNYTDTVCAEGTTVLDTKAPFIDNATLHYEAPRLTGGQMFNDYLMRNMFYPEYAKENNQSGKVYMRFTILKSGEIVKISVVKSAWPSLDKEAVRVMRDVRFATPAMIDGKPVDLCITMPLSFHLE